MAWASLRELEAHTRLAHAVAPVDTASRVRLARHFHRTGRLLHALGRSPNA